MYYGLLDLYCHTEGEFRWTIDDRSEVSRYSYVYGFVVLSLKYSCLILHV